MLYVEQKASTYTTNVDIHVVVVVGRKEMREVEKQQYRMWLMPS